MAKTRLFDIITPGVNSKDDKSKDVKIEVYCWACQRMVPITEITLDNRHDEDNGGCGCYIR